MKKGSIITVILFGLCAVIWSIRVLLDVIYRSFYNDSVITVLMCGLNVLCAIIWIVAFVVQVKRYRSNKDE